MKSNSNFSLKQKLIFIVAVPLIISTLIALIVSAIQLKSEGETGLENKSTAILSRMEAVRTFVAHQDMLDETIELMKEKYSDGAISMQDKDKILNQVPIIASMKVGKHNANSENYEFRIASEYPRNPQNKATDEELKLIQKLKTNNQETIKYIDKKNNQFVVARPVFLKEHQGCLKCHGNPQNSPFKNGKDVLGYQMENWKENDMRGLFMIKSDLKPIQARTNRTILFISLLGLIVALIAIFLGTGVINRIISIFKQITTVSQKVAKGELREKIQTDSNDELGELAGYINKMIDALNVILNNIKDSAVHLAGATNEISATSNQISDGAQAQAAQFEELSSSVQNTANASENANKIAQNTSNDANQAGNEMNNALVAMQEIYESSKQVKETINIISEIAIQTNILALNAGVEAARAGEFGKGFAVVANEIKRLAEKSSHSADEVRKIIEVTNQKIENGVKISQSANEKINQIVDNVKNIAVELQNITGASQEQSLGMEKNTSITTANAASAEELAASSNALSEQAALLQEIVIKFNLENSQ